MTVGILILASCCPTQFLQSLQETTQTCVAVPAAYYAHMIHRQHRAFQSCMLYHCCSALSAAALGLNNTWMPQLVTFKTCSSIIYLSPDALAEGVHAARFAPSRQRGIGG